MTGGNGRALELRHEEERAQWGARMRVLEHARAAAVEAARVAREERDAALARVDAEPEPARGEPIALARVGGTLLVPRGAFVRAREGR